MPKKKKKKTRRVTLTPVCDVQHLGWNFARGLLLGPFAEDLTVTIPLLSVNIGIMAHEWDQFVFNLLARGGSLVQIHRITRDLGHGNYLDKIMHYPSYVFSQSYLTRSTIQSFW